MLAKLSQELPNDDGWLFEPKWDGFRALLWKAGGEVFIQSRELKPLGRYFPEIEAEALAQLPEGCVLDGELVIVNQGRLDFEAMQLRLHPAKSRVKMLSESTPASYVAWDLLALGDQDLRPLPQAERRTLLERALGKVRPPFYVTPATTDLQVAGDWFRRFEGAGFDGVIAKRQTLPYSPDKRVMLKIKHQRTADCVVAGFRWFKGGHGSLVGSLVLGLFDEQGQLHPVGVCASFKREARMALAQKLAPLREGALENHPWREWAQWQASDKAATGRHASRWNPDKELSWEPLPLSLVVEVSYDHMQGSRFRHATHFVRWRPDKSPADCRYDQLEVTPPAELAEILPTLRFLALAILGQ